MNKKTPVNAVINIFFLTTTLHGFKYLRAQYFIDRFCWFLCCCASACCAGLLCAVLWARFMEMPALLALHDLRMVDSASERIPMVAVCPTTESIVELFVDKLSSDRNITKRLPFTVARVLEGKSAADDQLISLEQLLTDKNITLSELMFEHMLSCSKIVTKCRWQKVEAPGGYLFERELMTWGICCVMRPAEKFHYMTKKARQLASLQTTRRLDLALRCSRRPSVHGCLFYTKYDGEEWKEPVTLTQGYNYMAQLRFTSIPESTSSEKLVQDSCISQRGYSRRQCLEKCAEQTCGCIDPLRAFSLNLTTELPPCSITRLTCLRTYGIRNNNISCNCLPSCKKVTSDLTLETNSMKFTKHTIDPIYEGLNVTSSVVINFRVNINLSRIFTINPTETWLTLLSSLGGVFNMFLGVGLFSALEFLFFVFIKLPMAWKSLDIVHPSPTTYS